MNAPADPPVAASHLEPEAEVRGGNALNQLFGGNLRQFGMVGALLLIVVVFQVSTGGTLLTSDNLMALLNGNAYILVLAIGMVMVIIAGHIDLSVGSVAAFVAILVAKSVTEWGWPWWLSVLLGLGVGLLVGLWQGVWVAYIGVPAFIVTLAGMLIFRGANQLVGNSQSVPVPEQIQYLGGGYLPEIGPNTGYNNLTLLLGILGCLVVAGGIWRARLTAIRLGSTIDPLWVTIVKMVVLSGAILALTYQFATGPEGTSFPIPGLVLLVLVIVYTFITSRTVLGRHVYAVGGNKQAAELSGVKSKQVNLLVMTNMGFLAAIAAILFIGRSTASGPADGDMWELDAIAAVFIGGAAVSGGVGTVPGSIIGGLVMATLNNGLQLEGIGADVTSIIKGLVLLAAVGIDVWNKNQGNFSIIGSLMKSGRSRQEAPAHPS
ncbi:multiple monosaccharide ABC transporter permease [Demetria terragena]|uniref:multiple monosaccharide ABC transporter permease n=1 Tax=Demetria terragena TaxID=63959 RepID=UPI000364EBDF|nr:multiple monosaccharide ABC transporter permease [Demetria terragena]